jgi:hypothetical protein
MLTIVFAVAIAISPSAVAVADEVASAPPIGPHVPLKQSSDCDSNYSGTCVPAGASDVDCAGGSGNGPEYVSGPVYVEGDDVHELDRDGDGVACEPTN